MKGIQELITHIDGDRQVIIQAHDFPDHDAVGAAFALHHLLTINNIESMPCYRGRIQSASLTETIRVLDIPIRRVSREDIPTDTQIVVVDSFYGNQSRRSLPGEVIAIIDHHRPPIEPVCKYLDIRESYGSCCTILYEYFKISKTELNRNLASALLIGLMMDTAFMTRGVTSIDLEAFSTLFHIADWQMSTRLLRNSLSIKDLKVFREAIDASIITKDVCFVSIQRRCTPEVMALIADFLLGLREIHFVVVVFRSGTEYRLSTRSEDINRPADSIIREVLDGIGNGGGHFHMGGGVIQQVKYPGDETLRSRFLSACRRRVAT